MTVAGTKGGVQRAGNPGLFFAGFGFKQALRDLQRKGLGAKAR